MDSLKNFKGKGYDKVETNLEDQQNPPQHRHKISKPFVATISIIITTTLFITLTLCFTLFFHHTESHTPLNSTDSIRSICNVTRFPDSCFIALSPYSQNLTNPTSILKLSIFASIDELTKLKLASSLKANSNERAFDDCKDLIDDAVSRLNESVSAVPDGAVTLTDVKIKDIQTWVSAALTEQQTCVDELEEVGLSLETVEKVKKMMQKSNEYTSNSLAIVAHINNLLPIH
ncbi:unnamed protein product [Lathyrus sativus]|nr:unnamed protein product [Lathyrus sativus]